MPPRRRQTQAPANPAANSAPPAAPETAAADAAPEPLPQQEEFYRAPARFGNVPVESYPKGYDRNQRFERHYPRINLPIQIVERVPLGHPEPHEPNRLIWGDNLHIMRQLPSNSVDLIYIDPPFFSGRQYNVIWGDNNELRSFEDLWDGGMDGYLVWLNARLYEMKRLLTPAGSIYVHCDWHASHYIKVEMDKIFGYENFMNEIVWKRTAAHSNAIRCGNVHDVVFFYSKSPDYVWNNVRQKYDAEYIETYYRYIDDDGRRFMSDNLAAPSQATGDDDPRRYSWNGVTRVWRFSRERMEELDSEGRIFYTKNGVPRRKRYLDEQNGMALQDMWLDIQAIRSWHNERIGYPTQKPEALIDRIIQASSNEGAVVLDAFVGGGSTGASAMRLGRRFLGIDQSRVAIAVTAERLKNIAETRGLNDPHYPDFTVEQWGIYEAERLSAMPPEQFRDFVLRAYGATRVENDSDADIHGWHNQLPIWVGAPALASQATAAEVLAFANAIRRTLQYQQANLRDGVMLAWGFGEDARQAAEELRRQEAVDVNFVRLSQVRIGDDGFREHIVSRSTDKADYSDFLTFVRPPVVSVGHRALGGNAVTFDAGDTAVVNSGAKLINVQWDFSYDGRRFSATPGYSFQRDRNKQPQLVVTHKFAGPGLHRVACRVQDSRGGEGLWQGEVEVR